MAAGEEKQHLLSEAASGRSYLGATEKNGVQGQEPSLELGARRGQHCHTRGATSHPGQQQRARRKLYLAAGICLVFMVGEAVGGYLAHSLAILTDAAHLLTDFASIMISLFALWVSSRPPTKTMNFGWHRAGWGWPCTRRAMGTATGLLASSPTPASVLPSSTSWGICCRASVSSLHPTSSSLRHPQRDGLQRRAGNAAGGGGRGGRAQPPHLGSDCSAAAALCAHRHQWRATRRRCGTARSANLPATEPPRVSHSGDVSHVENKTEQRAGCVQGRLLGLVALGRYLGCLLGAKAARTEPGLQRPEESSSWKLVALIFPISIQQRTRSPDGAGGCGGLHGLFPGFPAGSSDAPNLWCIVCSAPSHSHRLDAAPPLTFIALVNPNNE
ncbi:proton-coupled zinc antiporter SLC30A2 isoform X3 [Cuculus canorus]|uniref:proton-coupled zinc antiporter SLC30A2 isoform X3 n=1 Tax=Cuculus canorus TaxID=55661 RepID=UPI0023AA4880|nr:proton-coupled zinc antiporter SLC30A2 isoform X3 [Cuculus canorus]